MAAQGCRLESSRVQGSRVLRILSGWGLGLKGFKGLGFRFGV